MTNFKLNKTLFNRRSFEKVVDTSFKQYAPPSPEEDTITVEQFFDYYNKLFYDIPTQGDTNSHAYLVKTSREYIKDPGIDANTQLLLDEISSLQQQNLALNQQLINMQIPSSSQNTL